MAENYITCQGDKGNINISEDVIVSVVRGAITEIDGVAGLANTAGADLAELLGIKTLSKASLSVSWTVPLLSTPLFS